MRRRWWLIILVFLVILGLWLARGIFTPSSKTAYRESVLKVLKGQEVGLDPGLAFLLRGLREDLNCRDEDICLRKENFSYVFDLAEQYEHLLGDYQGRICQSERLRPDAESLADHERLCNLLEKLFKEVRGVKMTASIGLQLSIRASQEAQSILRGALARILEHRERVLAITEELRGIGWLEEVLPAAKP